MFELKVKHKTAAKEGREAASSEDVEEEEHQQMNLEDRKVWTGSKKINARQRHGQT